MTETETRDGRLLATRFDVTVQRHNHFGGFCPNPLEPCERTAAEQMTPRNAHPPETFRSSAVRTC